MSHKKTPLTWHSLTQSTDGSNKDDQTGALLWNEQSHLPAVGRWAKVLRSERESEISCNEMIKNVQAFSAPWTAP